MSNISEPFQQEVQIAHQVLPRLWIGTEASCGTAKHFGFERLCVHEALAQAHDCKCIPVLVNGSQTTIARLDEIYLWIHEALQRPNCGVLVHCGGGQERAGLAVMHYLRKSFGASVDESYEWIMRMRPQIKDRRNWLKG